MISSSSPDSESVTLLVAAGICHSSACSQHQLAGELPGRISFSLCVYLYVFLAWRWEKPILHQKWSKQLQNNWESRLLQYWSTLFLSIVWNGIIVHILHMLYILYKVPVITHIAQNCGQHLNVSVCRWPRPLLLRPQGQQGRGRRSRLGPWSLSHCPKQPWPFTAKCPTVC